MMADKEITPLDHGITTVDTETLELDWSSPISQELVDMGYRMVSAEVDESGYFLTVRFENVKLNHVRSLSTGVPLCKENTHTIVTLDHDEDKFLCPACKKLIDERPS